ncbi:MAG: alkaline shock response membrane anchor protein AmaP [Eubacteriales bacterium]|nr:alkaline shock response membrane anchor protein AmaP [Bacillota bacterium]MBV1727269.1 alkaline shock response membrane anchor protein AmaP [Desulforudis sp.]MDZ4043147.1 alkaline shock response membrane anchor protein AmaP [Eubacteriales bacterium]MBU4554594.1 alkaline shock response membrane anchor protein AmaP [Bacillota bacterium]MBV1736091.1 alkaline shock response membrane anchor protein AmaP [Desulforudis sp.]
MGPFDRMLLAIYTVTISVAAVLGLLLLTGLIAPDPLVTIITRDVAIAVLGVFLLVSLRLLWTTGQKKPERQAVVDDNALGQVKITLTAIESLITKVVAPIPGIREVKPKVVSDRGIIAIEIKAAVTPDINIPDTSKAIQETVQNSIRDVTGINVEKIKILVESIASTKGRVE